MSALSIQVPFPVFQDRDGQPLDNGYVWLGTSSLNPQTNPVVAYYDSALTIVATQPLRTLNGFISRAGSPAQVYVDAVNFSILVQDSKGTTVFSVPEGTGISPNASGVVYDPAGTGAVATTVQAKLRQTISVKDFGALGDGSTNDTVALQAAIVAAAGATLYIPEGDYRYTTLTIAAGMSIVGDGAGSLLYTTMTGGGGITVTTIDAVYWRDLVLTSAGSQTSGAYVLFDPTVSGENTQSSFTNVQFANYYIGLQFESASLWTVDNCYFGTAGIAGTMSLKIENTYSGDSGDNCVLNNIFYFSNNVGTHIRHSSSGGLRVAHNKFLYGEKHYHMSLGATVATSDLQFTGNSSEFAADGNMIFDCVLGGTFGNVQIQNNQFTSSTNKYGVLVNDNTAAWLTVVSITGNTFGSNAVSNGVVLNSVSKCILADNIFNMFTNSVGISLGTTISAIDVRPQSYGYITTPISGNLVGTEVATIHSNGYNFDLTAAASKVVTIPNIVTNSVALVVVGGTVQNVGYVSGLYMVTTVGTVATVAAIANVAVTATASTITVTNNTGQIFNGKVLVLC